MRFALKPFVIGALLLASSVATFAQIRDYVPIVKAVYGRETIAFLEKLSDSMKADGYRDAAAILKAYATEGSGWGSGFLYVAKDGTNYVVTNRHVVAQADSITLEFEKPDGSQTVFKNCQVIGVGEDIDLALVALPASTRPFSAGMEFAKDAPEEGAELWTAGYPGDIDYNPTWQLGKGNVTNAAAKIASLVDPSITTLIQHSAQVDPGNSGGPLLLVDKSTKAGYKVVGINTWKDFDRQATNYSIPAQAVQAFIDATIARNGSAPKPQAAALEARCRAFISASVKKDDAYREIAKYVSYVYVERDGASILENVLSVAPTRVRDYIISAFVYESPIEGIRLAIAYKIASVIKAKSADSALGFVAIDGSADEAGAAVPVRFTLAGKELSLTWQQEHGAWSLSSYPLSAKADDKDKGKAKKESGTSEVTFDDSPYHVLFQFGADLPLNDSDAGKYWHLDATAVPDTYFSFGLTAGGQSVTVPATASEKASDATLVRVGGVLRGQLPIRTSFASFIPYVGADGGMQICLSTASDLSGIFSSVEAGLLVGIGEDPNLYIGGAYKYFPAPLLLAAGDDSSSSSSSSSSAVSLWLGLGF